MYQKSINTIRIYIRERLGDEPRKQESRNTLKLLLSLFDKDITTN